MATIYNKELCDENVINFIENYVESIKSFKHDRFHAIMSLIPESCGHILDYGCGWGHFANEIKNKNNKVTAIDLSPNAIEICNIVWKSQENLSFSTDLVTSFDANSFDLVLSNQVIEHVHNVGNYLSSINRVLKPNGLLVVSLPNVMNPRFFFGLLRGNLEDRLRSHSRSMLSAYDKGEDHINAWDPFHFTTLLASMGFTLKRYIPTEGIAMPSVKGLCPPYIYLQNKSLRNLSYTMTFLFEKTNTVTVENND